MSLLLLLTGDDAQTILDQIRPNVSDIGTLLHNRTTVDGGGEAGTFNSQTDPTGTQVDNLIDVAVNQIAVQVPAELTPEQIAYVKVLISYLAAILVEKSHFSEQVESGDSEAGLYSDLLREGLLLLGGLVNNDNVTAPRAYGTPIGTVVASAVTATEVLP